MAESSLFFNGVDFCPRISEYRDRLTDLRHLVGPQEGVERRLDDRTDRQCKDKDKAETPYSEVCDFVVDRLLL